MGSRILFLVPFAIIGSVGILFSIGFAYILSAGIGLFLIAKLLSFRYRVNREFLRETVRFNFINYSSSLVHNLPALVLPIILINLLDSESVALFSIAFAFYNLIGVIPDSVGQAFFVEGSHGVGLKKGVYQSISLTYLVLVPVVIIIFLWGSLILGFFGPQYVQALWTLELLAVSRLFYNVYNIFISFQLIRWKSESLVFTSLISSGMLLGLCYLLVIPYGLAGIGYAYLISNIIMAAGVIIYLRLKGWV
jgi:O-antigen/teichoic acid export membrane protein